MFYLITGFFLLLAQLALISTRNITIYSEMFFYPWLISKHVILYKDVWINHGFLLYFLLSFLPTTHSLIFHKIFFTVTELANLFLTLLVTKKYKSKLVFVLTGIFYITITTLVSENSLWDEIFLTTTYLFIYYVITSGKRLPSLIGVLVGFCFFIKPTAIVFLIPTMVFGKNRKFILLCCCAALAIGFIYLWYSSSLFPFLDNVILYNIHYGKYFSHFVPSPMFGDFFNICNIIISLLVIVTILERKFSQHFVEFSFLIFSYVFLIPKIEFIHAAPFAAFFTIYSLSVIVYSKKQIKIFLILMFVIFYFFYLYRQAKHEYIDILPTRVSYFDTKQPTIALHELEKIKIPIHSLYVYGNQREIYYLANTLPPCKYLDILPWVSDYYFNMEDRLISCMREKEVNVIIEPKPEDIYFSRMKKLDNFLYTNYRSISNDTYFEIYIKK